MATNVLDSSFVRGSLGATTFNLSAGCVTDAAVAASAGIQATKLEHQFPLRYQTAAGSAVATATHPIHIVRGATGEIVSLDVSCTTAPTSSDTVAVDLQKSTGGGAFATVLSAAVTLSSSSTSRVVYSGTVNTAGLVDGDILQVVVTVSGTTGQGLVAVVFLREDAA